MTKSYILLHHTNSHQNITTSIAYQAFNVNFDTFAAVKFNEREERRGTEKNDKKYDYDYSLFFQPQDWGGSGEVELS